MKKIVLLAVIVMCLIFSSCANKAQTGAATGAAGGALIGQAIGGNTQATVAMALLGTLVGYLVGNEMDRSDQRRLAHTFETTPAGQTSGWTNPDSNNQYKVTPGAKYSQDGKVCRPAEIEAIIDGKPEKTKTQACKNSNGDWILQT